MYTRGIILLRVFIRIEWRMIIMVKEVKGDNFDDIKACGVAVADYSATWCGPCKMMAPIVEEMAKTYAGKVDFYKVDIDKEQELAQTFGIQSIPTFLFIPVKGKPSAQMGAMQKADFEEMVKTVLK